MSGSTTREKTGRKVIPEGKSIPITYQPGVVEGRPRPKIVQLLGEARNGSEQDIAWGHWRRILVWACEPDSSISWLNIVQEQDEAVRNTPNNN